MMTARKFIKPLTLTTLMLGTGLALSACEKTRQQFDFSKRAPDEFAVMTRAPLEIPESLSQLPQPLPGAPRPQEISPSEQARQTMLGEGAAPPRRAVAAALRDPSAPAPVSAGEALLLQKTGAAQTDPSIRRVVDQETAEIAEQEMPGVDHIRRWVGQNVEAPAKVVDPVAETQRIRDAREQGQPITHGNTPTKDN